MKFFREKNIEIEIERFEKCINYNKILKVERNLETTDCK